MKGGARQAARAVMTPEQCGAVGAAAAERHSPGIAGTAGCAPATAPGSACGRRCEHKGQGGVHRQVDAVLGAPLGQQTN